MVHDFFGPESAGPRYADLLHKAKYSETSNLNPSKHHYNWAKNP